MTLHKSIRALIAAAVGVTVKLPAAYDIAGSYETVADWSKVYPKPRLVIHKATEGNFYSDPKLYPDFAGMAANGIRRGCYHFHRKAIDAKIQAQYFCNFIRQAITPADKLILDVEEGSETPGQIIAWLDEVERQFTNEIIIYSTKYLLDQLTAKCTATQLTRLKKYRLWIAFYPLYPDLYSSIPAGYIPANLGKVIMWQYSENGTVSGISGEVDLDWLDPAFAAELGEVPQSDVIIPSQHKGMIHYYGKRNRYPVHVFDIDPAYFDFGLVSTPNLETVPSVAKRTGATLALNAGEWNDRDKTNTATYLKPESYTVSNGQLVQYRLDITPSLMVTDTNQIIVDHRVQTANIMQAFSGLRYIVGPLTDSSGWSTEGHARTCYGVNTAGHIIIMLSEGVYPNQGLTLLECRAVMQQYGAVTAFDGGGGGDAGGVLDGQDLIKPENISNGVNVYRALPMIFCLYAKDVNMSDGIAKEKLGNISKVRKTPSRYGVEISVLPAYTNVTFTEKVDTIPQGTADKAGEMWLKLTDGNYVNFKLYNTAGVLTQMFDIVQEPSVTPPPDWIVSETWELSSGSKKTTLWNSGKVDIYIVP